MRQYETVFGDVISADCLACIDRTLPELQKLQIAEGEYFYVEQDIELAYPGMAILASKRHIQNYSDMNGQELNELNELITRWKNAVSKIFKVERFMYQFWERDGGHFHFVMIPILDFMNIEAKYGILGEIMEKNSKLKNDGNNMKLVSETIDNLRKLF
jgi:diadenosine tetraphosphate (Ap4A) HIT family hydrolase